MNSFGTSSLQFRLVDPREVRDARYRFRRSSVPLLNRVNSFYCPAGKYPSRGWILLPRYEYIKLDTYSTSLQLNIGDPNNANNVGTLKNLSIVHAQCVTAGTSTEQNTLYLIELTDARGILANEWFQFPTTSFYNIRSPGYPQVFQSLSLNSGTTWTWSTMIGDLWNQMSSFLGTYPGIPAGITLTGTPEGFWFPGVSAWNALNDILAHLGLIITCDLTLASPFAIVSDGADDPAFTALQTKYVGNMEDDLEWIDTGAGRVPKTIKILFRRRNATYGTEETVRYDSFQWDMTPFYSVSVTAPATFASAIGTHFIWSDFTIRYDQDGNPNNDDVAAANNIAQERVRQYFDKIYSRTSGSLGQTYGGALPFTNGSQVDGVCWYQNYDYDRWQGWRTQIVRGKSPPWPDMWNS